MRIDTVGHVGSNQQEDDGDWLGDQVPSFPYLSSEELIRHFFPSYLDAERLLSEKIAEWQNVAQEARGAIKAALKELQEIEDPWSKWFCGEVLKISPAARQLKDALRQIARLGRLRRSANRVFRHEDSFTGDSGSEGSVAIARQARILEVISCLLEVKKAGKRYLARCPFHDDANPSLTIYPESNRFKCYGCQKGGDAIEFVMLYRKCGFKQAIDYLTRGGNEDGR